MAQFLPQSSSMRFLIDCAETLTRNNQEGQLSALRQREIR